MAFFPGGYIVSAGEPNPNRRNALRQFIQKHCKVATSVLSGFDCIVFRGILRGLMFLDGMKRHLSYKDAPRRFA